MPIERFTACQPHALADMAVIWESQEEQADQPDDLPDRTPYVDLFPCAPEGVDGGIYLCPNGASKAELGLGEDVGVGPVRVSLDRAGVNRLITTLREARDEAFGADA